MCGIVGIASVAPHPGGGSIDRALDAIAHRGPDDSGVYRSPSTGVVLGNRRLSIIDLSAAGHMPMGNEDGTVWVTYNGEVYNAPQLRRDLEARGHVFRSDADTEVLVHGFEEWGSDLPGRLNGMFAFAAWDEKARRLLVARDHLGIKPLYYREHAGTLAFASEAKSLYELDGQRPELNVAALPKYLTYLWTPAPETLVKGVVKLRPGHLMEWSGGAPTVRQYWDLDLRPDRSMSPAEHIESLRAALHDSVRRQLRSDVPVGLLLSGGLDSTGLLALASKERTEPIDCFTIAFRAEDAVLEQCPDEHLYARRAAEHYGARYHETVLAPHVAELLPRLLWHLDEPIADPAAINTYLISEAARRDVTVLLTGQGSDELFAGYRLHQVLHVADRYPWLGSRTVGPAINAFGRGVAWAGGKVPGLSRGLGMGVQRVLGDIVAAAAADPRSQTTGLRAYYDEVGITGLLTDDALALMTESRSARHDEYYDTVASADAVSRAVYLDAKTILPELNLAYCDKMSMAASVESRVPFLDLEVVRAAAALPPELKIHGRTRKYALREALRPDLPAWVLDRRKVGFGAPIRQWLRTDLAEMVGDLLSEDTVRRRGVLRPEAVARMIRENQSGEADHAFRLWALLTLEVWQRSVLEGGHGPGDGAV